MSELVWYETNMSSNTSPSPLVASASSEFSSAFNAFRSIENNSYWGTDNYSQNNAWLKIDFGELKIVDKFRIKGHSALTENPKTLRLDYSLDNITWTKIYESIETSWTPYEIREFNVPKTIGRYFKLTVVNNHGSSYSSINKLQFGFYDMLAKFTIQSNSDFFSFDTSTKTLIHLPNSSASTLMKYGVDKNKEIDLTTQYKNHLYVTYDVASGIFNESTVVVADGFSVYDYLVNNPIIKVISETDIATIETEVDLYSVYEYIGDLPEVVIYTEDKKDVIVSTTTEPFDIYDEFGDSVEVLYYTDDTEVTNADLILEANYSPLDELEGDFEVVTWTDEAPETAQRVLEMQAIPKPQFIKLVNPKRIYGALDDVIVNDISQSYRDEARYFISGTDTTKWYVWDSILKKFIIADASSEEAIIANGMKHTDLNNITDTEWRTWNEQHLNIGIFLKDNPRDTIVSVVENVSYEDYLPRHTAAIQDTSLYILNTTAKIDIAFNGNVLKGVLSDDDLTRVQYRVLLNNRNFYPSDGSFTKLGESPQNIELVIRSKDIKIDDWNTLKVEFKDYFGTTDYWSTNFMGTYSGLMFKDVYGEYFSNEIGDVLKYLDFGVIIAGQTTIEHEVILKNQYGYDVKNVHLFANTANFPTEMTVEFSQSQSPFIPHPDLKLSGVLANNAEMPFFIRLKTKLGSTPDANGSFDIIVRADKA
ncbi:discoidin domain-containing protein [Lysinibacillus sp. NPDC093210]|uniref:discoidin domain-containing protein n=1 Tax=Lysinibacillus sp. NPDC093210 TaxID=3364133 RepID=UPI0038038C8F